MLINGSNLMKKVVLLLEKESKFLQGMQELSEKGETAKNLQNTDELIKLGEESAEMQKQVNSHILEKTIIMSMVVSKNPNFREN
jgi:excinuclease UvrABC nuclease subunit